MKIIGKTQKGFIVEMTANEAAKAAGFYSSYSSDWQAIKADIGTEIRFTAAMNFHTEIQKRQDEAKKAAGLLRALADMMDGMMPEIVLQPTHEGEQHGE